MNKKLLIGSILVLSLLLLMPSISAIQHNIVKDDIKDRILSELSEELDFKDIPNVKHFWLYFFVLMFMDYRWERFKILAELSYEVELGDWGGHITVKRPILYIRCMILLITTMGLGAFFQILSDTLYWDWYIPGPYE